MTAAEKSNVGPITIQADHPRNCDLLIQGLQGVKLRSTIKSSRTVKVQMKDGSIDEVVPTDQAVGLGAYPEIPGMLLQLDPRSLSWKITDPLKSNPDILKRVTAKLVKENKFSGEFAGVPTTEGKLDPDRFKTLYREVVNIVEANEATVKSGSLPSLEEIDAMKGDYLLSPMMQVTRHEPRYEKDVEQWVSRMNHTGA